MKPEIITMCGSTRFSDLMACISWEYEKLGKIVLRVNYVPEWYAQKEGWTESSHGAEQSGLKQALDDLHCRKIDLCDKVYVCNMNNYIGESTRREIEYAQKVGKPVYFLMTAFDDGKDMEIHDIAQKLARWWIDAYEVSESVRDLISERNQATALLRKLLPMAEDGYKASDKGRAFQEFEQRDRTLLAEAKEFLKEI